MTTSVNKRQNLCIFILSRHATCVGKYKYHSHPYDFFFYDNKQKNLAVSFLTSVYTIIWDTKLHKISMVVIFISAFTKIYGNWSAHFLWLKNIHQDNKLIPNFSINLKFNDIPVISFCKTWKGIRPCYVVLPQELTTSKQTYTSQVVVIVVIIVVIIVIITNTLISMQEQLPRRRSK